MPQAKTDQLVIPVRILPKNKCGILVGRLKDFWGNVSYEVLIDGKHYILPMSRVRLH